ncbi:MAG: sensor domain-containing diguanylate cyclase [Gammaproteobacteria bacterium]|nr:MAG: sensor domain-containing diguanylate cyclase [Gammaproteobacteria bacterium]
MNADIDSQSFLRFIVDRVNVGVVVLNKEMEVLLWNNFMELNSGYSSDDMIGKNLFESFSDLPKKWLEKKIKSVFILKNFAFTGWEQRSYLFRFKHNRPVTGNIDYMRQNCTFLPIMNDAGEVQAVCITVFDVTDTSIYQTKLKEAMGRLEEMSIRDGLTGIYNRRHLENQLASEFDRVRRYGGILSIILFDLDHFKNINDTYGHLAGDEVLKSISSRLEAVLRNSDIAGRYGGEEFTVILPNTDAEGAAILAERLRKEVEESEIIYDGQKIPVTISVGVTLLSDNIENHEMLLNQADTALYYCKENGRNQVKLFDKTMTLI